VIRGAVDTVKRLEINYSLECL